MPITYNFVAFWKNSFCRLFPATRGSANHESGPDAFAERQGTYWISLVTRWIIILLAFSVPLFFLPGTFDAFRPPKDLLVQFSGLTLICLGITRHILSGSLFRLRFDSGMLEQIKANPLATLLGLGLLWMGISCIISPVPWVSLRSWVMALACSGIVWGVAREADVALSHKTAWAMIIAGWINTFWALLQFFGKDPYFVTDMGKEITGERVFISAFTGNPNFLAPFLLFCLILSGFMLATAASMQIKIVHCLSAALLFVGILISQTMATLICMPVIALILGIAFMRAGHVSGLKVTATVLGVVLLISGSIFGTTLLGGEFHNRVMTWVRSAKLGQIDHLLNGRYFLWLSTWEMILDKPFLGHGLATLRHNAFRYQANVPDLDYFEFTKQYFLMHEAHNDYLQVWAETGLVGLCLLLAGLGIYSRRVWRYHCTGSEFGEGKQETLGEKTAEKAQSILAKDRRLFAGAWTTIVLAGMANALANFPLYLSNLLVILAMALAFSARFTGLWPAPPVNRTVQQPSGRLMRLLLAAGLTCLTLLTCLWLLPPYQALRLQRPIKATLERLADLRVARKADTALSLTQAREAVKEAERAVKLDPWSPENHLFLALAYFYNFQFERASMAFERACFLKNEQVLCANWGASLAEMGDFANGRRKLGLAMLFNPFQMQARDTLRKIGEYRDGVAYPPLTWLHYPELAKPTH